jgi:hypothetical protein
MLLPFLLLVLAKVALERLLSPRAINRVGYRSKCGNGSIFSSILQELIIIPREEIKTISAGVCCQIQKKIEDNGRRKKENTNLQESKHHVHPYYVP